MAAAVLLAVVIAPASAQETSEPAAQQEKKICRSQKMTGSLTRRIRTCMTKAEWDRLAEGSQRTVDRLSREGDMVQPTTQSGMPGGG
ncbi:MAG: hypothetical protein B7Z33_02815 [Sphingomonadales bacterium 12-68-11]|nr:MAG: hypothetical protein B7Z33_02815 [Sphingomonadales bacterium 12-68-11]